MPDVSVERRSAPRRAMVLAAEVVELPRGAKLSARTADISRTGCYIDTLNPIPSGSEVRIRLTHHEETFVAVARVVYVSYGLGMGIAFVSAEDDQLARLDRWLSESGREF
jgi:PilZ domain-containing protein